MALRNSASALKKSYLARNCESYDVWLWIPSANRYYSPPSRWYCRQRLLARVHYTQYRTHSQGSWSNVFS
jgi:hypothetical protein